MSADPSVATHFLTFKYLLRPTRQQHEALERFLEDQRQLYNAALEERIGCYRATGKNRSFIDQSKALTVWRKDDVDAAACPLNIQRWTVKRLDDAYTGFFRRLSARKAKVGSPRFRSEDRWDSFGFSEFIGIRLDGTRLRWKGLPGSLRVHLHRPLPANADIRSCVFRHDGRRWFVCFDVRLLSLPAKHGGDSIGIDVGLTHLATLSDGTRIANRRTTKRAKQEQRRRHRAFSRCKRGSKRRNRAKGRLAAIHRSIANARRTYLHEVSAGLVRKYGTIVVEKLNVKGLASGMLAHGVNDAAWGILIGMLRYKAAGAGAQLVEVNPRGTSRECPDCGTVKAKKLSERVHRCPCGCVMDRDHAAALVILSRRVLLPELGNVARLGERRVGNIGGITSVATPIQDLEEPLQSLVG